MRREGSSFTGHQLCNRFGGYSNSRREKLQSFMQSNIQLERSRSAQKQRIGLYKNKQAVTNMIKITRWQQQLWRKRKEGKRDIVVYTDGSVTKDQSGWCFTVKQGATTIHEDSAAYTVSTSSFTMEVEAVTHALRWIASLADSRTTLAIILADSMSLLQKVKSGMGSPD